MRATKDTLKRALDGREQSWPLGNDPQIALSKAIAQQQKQLAVQQANAAQQEKQIEALAATVQKVSDEIQRNRPAPQLVANDQ
jgi:hypothetical protein